MSEKSKVLDTFKIVIDDFQREYNDLEKLAEEKNFELQEKERYLETFVEKEESDFKLFSPRNVESVYKEEITEKNIQIQNLEEERKKYFNKMGFLSNHINKLTTVYESILDWEGNGLENQGDIEVEYVKRFQNCERENFDYRLLVMDMQEKDRQRMARELHDSTIQDLTHTIHVLELAQKFSNQDPVRARMELLSASKGIRETIDDLRNKIFDLRPMSIDDLGYKETFERLRMHIKNISNIEATFSVDEIDSNESIDSILLYRIIQECCMNAVKHSNATKIEVSLKKIDQLHLLKVIDNGEGFNVEEIDNNKKYNFGIEMMKERVKLLKGNIKIVSENNIGTTIIVSFPRKSIS